MSIITILIVAIVVIVIGSIVYNYACDKDDKKSVPMNIGKTKGLEKAVKEYRKNIANCEETIKVPGVCNTDEDWSKTYTSEQAIREAKERVKTTKKVASKSTVKKTKPKTTKKTTAIKKSSTTKSTKPTKK